MIFTILPSILGAIAILLIILFRPRPNNNLYALSTKMDELFRRLDALTGSLKDDFKTNRQELHEVLNGFRKEMQETLFMITRQNKEGSEAISKTLDEKITALAVTIENGQRGNRETVTNTLKEFSAEQKTKFDELKSEQKEQAAAAVAQLEAIRNKLDEKLAAMNERAKADAVELNRTLKESFQTFGETFAQNVQAMQQMQQEKFGQQAEKQMLFVNKTEEHLVRISTQAKADSLLMREALQTSFADFKAGFTTSIHSFNELLREKFGQLEDKQNQLVSSTEKRLDQVRETVEEKLQKTLTERLGQSFDMVSKQLNAVQQGLGEMQTLAQDVGGLKKVLSNVKMRGGFGEVQLQMLLENILAPEQYEANVATVKGSSERVEFAVKFPNREGDRDYVWLPIDAKFPKDAYEQLQLAYDVSDPMQIELAQKNLEQVIRKMAKDICEKYIDTPNTTNFGIMFLPFEGLFAEVVRKAALLEDIQRSCKVIITGPTTLAVILNSLQMGFRTLAIQKRSSEVWQVLGEVKKEFKSFGGMLEKAQSNIQTGLNQLDDVVGKRTRAIQRKLKGVEVLVDEQKALDAEEALQMEQ